MKKITLLFFLPLLLTSCNQSSINIPKSPFKDDKYERIGTNSEYQVASYLTDEEFNKLKEATTKDETTGFYHSDKKARHYVRNDETRDLKYAYFGKETSSVFFNSLSSRLDEASRYSNQIKIDNSSTHQIIQMAMGDNDTLSMSDSYTFDTGTAKKEAQSHEYKQHVKTQTNDETPVVTEKIPATHYENEDDVFAVKPYENAILQHFIETDTYHFKILGDNAVYGKTKDGHYLIKEGYSVFNKEFTTTMGRKYVASDNYFYEALLDNIDGELCFTCFRFYHDTLILSEAYNGTGVPILYLEKPVLVYFNEVKYHIDYSDIGNYTGEIPEPTKPTK